MSPITVEISPWPMPCSLSPFPHLRQQLPFDLEILPESACLVGGAVRDALLGRRREYLDWDFVVPQQAIEIAQALARQYHAGFVILDKVRQIARVVFAQGTVDFAQQEGATLEQDLGRRDFTVNAIAYNLHQECLIDPLSGVKDLELGVLRMVSAHNLADDPLRLLRAYRQAAQLQFDLDPATRVTLRALADQIKTVAAERVQAEFNYLLGSPRGSQWLLAAWQDGLLSYWFPQANLDALSAICCIDLAVATVKTQLSLTERQAFFQALGKKGIAIAKLASLVSPVPEQAEQELEHLKYSRHEIRAVGAILKSYPALGETGLEQNLRRQYFFFLDVGKHFAPFVLYALAHSPQLALIFALLRHYLDPQDRIAHPQSLISGNDLIQNLRLRPGPFIGQLLIEVQVAQVEGRLTTATEALVYAQKLAAENGPR
ncbi:CCA tRNA nucleotidyltransferase [Synechocystis sp. LKSZ1]|uniref:CCA tRNA nucleotidyltransferase n=1 Tax=Synechocystis sp. LKSZ1 TaxID=3144951 RepID=UPI00336C285A